MLDYDAARSKVRKLVDKPTEDPTKLPKVGRPQSNSRTIPYVDMQAQQEHDEAKEVFDMLNDQLVTELPQLLDLRVPYFDPSFEAMIRMQSKFAEEGYEKLSGVQRYDSSFRAHFHILTLRPAISLIVSATTTPRAS
jgi:amphiphysin